MKSCKELTQLSIQLSDVLKQRRDPTHSITLIRNCLSKIIDMNRVIIPEFTADRAQDLGDMLMTELNDMDKAIQDAANRIEVIDFRKMNNCNLN